MNKAHELARRYKEIGVNAMRTADYRDWSPYFFWGCGLPGSGFVPGAWQRSDLLDVR